MKSFDAAKMKKKEMIPGLRLGAVHLENLTVTFVDLDAGCVMPEHSHPNEQISFIVKGTLRLIVAGVSHDLSEGQGVTIPANTPHSAVVVRGPVFAIDSFSPKRKDYVFE